MGHYDTSRVIAVIVTYNPDLAILEELLTALLRQVAMAVVVDNGSSNSTSDRLEQQRQLGSFELITLEENLGLAAAQNRGIRRARELGCTHVLLLDQDSIPAANMVARLLAAEEECITRGERVGVVGPRFIDPVTGAETWFHGRGALRYRYLRCSGEGTGTVVRADLLIASGMLIRCDVLDEVGAMDETLFIDLVDTEWCLRAAASGYGVFGVCDAVMQHSIGSHTVTAPGKVGRRATFPVHKPLRYYYMFRNSVLLTINPSIPTWWKLNNAMELLFLLMLLPIAADRRLASLKMILRGLVDGFRGKKDHCKW